MIKTETIEVDHYYCDKCGQEIPVSELAEVNTYVTKHSDEKLYRMHFCVNCMENLENSVANFEDFEIPGKQK